MKALEEIRRDFKACLSNGIEEHDDFITGMEVVRRLLEESETEPTWVDEVAVRMMAALQTRGRWDAMIVMDQAKFAYVLADALMAERERRSGK